MQSNKITNDFYDHTTHQILLSRLTDDDISYIKNEKIDLDGLVVFVLFCII